MPKQKSNSDINFYKIGKSLSFRQIAFLKGALNKTIREKRLRLSSPKEIWEELKFWILNPDQHKGISSFKHAVSRAMRILSDKNWRTPIGFHKYSDSGAKLKKEKEDRNKPFAEKSRPCQDHSSDSILSSNLEDAVSKLFSNTKETCALTDQALYCAKQLEVLFKDLHAKGVGDSYTSTAPSELVENLLTQLEGLLRQGANKHEILPYLQKLQQNF